jgi:hypothetical protein
VPVGLTPAAAIRKVQKDPQHRSQLRRAATCPEPVIGYVANQLLVAFVQVDRLETLPAEVRVPQVDIHPPAGIVERVDSHSVGVLPSPSHCISNQRAGGRGGPQLLKVTCHGRRVAEFELHCEWDFVAINRIGDFDLER